MDMEALLAAVRDVSPRHLAAARAVLATPLQADPVDDDDDPQRDLGHTGGGVAVDGDGDGDDDGDGDGDGDGSADYVGDSVRGADGPCKRARLRHPRGSRPRQGPTLTLERLLVKVTAPHVATDVEAVTELVNQTASPAHLVPHLLRWVVLKWSALVPWARVQPCAQCLTEVMYRFDALATPFGRKEVLHTLCTVGVCVRPWWEWFAAVSGPKAGAVVHRALAAWAADPSKTCGGPQ